MSNASHALRINGVDGSNVVSNSRYDRKTCQKFASKLLRIDCPAKIKLF